MSALRLTPAVIFVLGAIALLSSMPASAQDSAPAPKTAPSQSQPQAQSQEKGQNKGPVDQGKKAAPKRDQGPIPMSDATPPATSAGCGWIGKRVIHSLLRDDAVTAQDYDRLFHTFNCSPDHLRAAFDCTVAVGALPTATEAQTRVDSCWTDPKFDTKAAKIAPNETPAGAAAAGAAAGAAAQPKSGAGKSAPSTNGNGGSTPNYPEPKPR
jgi:hypothetical protein